MFFFLSFSFLGSSRSVTVFYFWGQILGLFVFCSSRLRIRWVILICYFQSLHLRRLREFTQNDEYMDIISGVNVNGLGAVIVFL